MLTEAHVKDALSQVIDPDIGVNIVDLGLVEAIRIDGSSVRVDMIMTTPACPQSGYLQDEASRALLAAGAGAAVVVVLDAPFWEPSRMSASAKAVMGWPG